jgi:hypothetical protein
MTDVKVCNRTRNRLPISGFVSKLFVKFLLDPLSFLQVGCASPSVNVTPTIRDFEAARPSLIGKAIALISKSGAACVTRTRDPRITNAMLYRLS